MAEIALTQGYSTIVDECDSDLGDKAWCATVTRQGLVYATRGMAVGSGNQRHHRSFLLHRVILERVLDRKLVKGEQVDHANRDTLDNRRSNLRLANASLNSMNRKRRSDNTSGFKGVTFNRKAGRYEASVWIKLERGRKHVSLGLFDTPEEAHVAYCAGALEHFGEFARFE